MPVLSLVFLIAALVVFVLATWPIPSKVNLLALGLALLTASFLVPHIP
jgi:hypothetical protein